MYCVFRDKKQEGFSIQVCVAMLNDTYKQGAILGMKLTLILRATYALLILWLPLN
jgi:hypothetical protein